MKFKNLEYQRKHDELVRKLKELNGQDLDEEVEKWKLAGYPKIEQSIESIKLFNEWNNNPRRDDIERNNKISVKSLREIHDNLDKNMAEQELRKRKKVKPKIKRKCSCKKK